MVYSGSHNSPLFNRYLATSIVNTEIPFYVDERESTDQTVDSIIAHKTHNVDKLPFNEHPTLLRNWAYINKYSKVKGYLDFYEPLTFYAMMGNSNMASLFLLCDMNNCRKEIEDVNWVVEKHRYALAAHYAFADKLDDDDVVVKRLAAVAKPLVFISQYKNKEVEYFLLQDNVERGYKEIFDEHDIETFVRRYLTSPHTMIPYRMSEGDEENTEFKYVKRLTGDNFDDLIVKSGKHWIVLIHEGHKSHQQALHNLNNFVRTYGHIFTRLGFAIYNQLINSSPIDIIKEVPIMGFFDRHKLYKLKTEGVNGVPIETMTDHMDLELMFSFLKANYPLRGELKTFVELTGLDVNPNPDDIKNLEEYDKDEDL